MADYQKKVAEKRPSVTGDFHRQQLIAQLADDWKANICHAASDAGTPQIARLAIALKYAEYKADERVLLVISKEIFLRHYEAVRRALGNVWVKTRAEAAADMVDAYMAISHKAILAEAATQKWGSHLRDYIRNTAMTQAQMIVDVSNPGWCRPPHIAASDGQRIAAYLDYCRKQAETGAIHVPVTKDLLEWCQICAVKEPA